MSEHDRDTPLRLADAVRLGFPHGGITVAGLRREGQRGNLRMWRIANKDFTSLAAISEMMDRCHVKPPLQNSSYVQHAEIAAHRGSSITSDVRSAQAAAKVILQGLRKPSRPTLRKISRRPDG